MDIDNYLTSTALIDCLGQVTHTLTLRLDGTVEIRPRTGGRIVVDPAQRSCLTPGVQIPEHLMDVAASLTPR